MQPTTIIQSARLNTNGHTAPVVDYDLHGLARVRLVHPSPSDTAAVSRQLGPIQATLANEPDIIIRFVEQLPVSSPIQFLGLNDAGFTDDAFLVLRTKHEAHAKVQISFDRIGSQCEILCERGLPSIPLLIPILNLTVLAKGAIPLHASAFTYHHTGVLATGWSKGGKTETLLSFMAQGAQYIGDEWVYISHDGNHIYGIPEPIRVWDWHLDSLPRYRSRVGWKNLVRLRSLKRAIRATEWMIAWRVSRDLPPVRLMRRILPLLKRQAFVDMRPHQLFGHNSCVLSGDLHKVLFVMSHDSPMTTVNPIDPREIAMRMTFSLQYERHDFMSYYQKFRFAFPALRNELIERAEELQREALLRVLNKKEAYVVAHPYPVSLPDLFNAIRPLCR